jgi:hypothetical protein
MFEFVGRAFGGWARGGRPLGRNLRREADGQHTRVFDALSPPLRTSLIPSIRLKRSIGVA